MLHGMGMVPILHTLTGQAISLTSIRASLWPIAFAPCYVRTRLHLTDSRRNC